MYSVKATYTNRTHKTLTIADGISLPANSTIELDAFTNKTLEQLKRLGLVTVTSANIASSSVEGTPYDEAVRSRRAQMRARAQMMKELKLKAAKIDVVESSEKVTKAASNTKSTNNKGK